MTAKRVTIRIIGLAAGGPSEFDDTYVREYDPSVLTVDGGYDGGVLKVTDDPAHAKQFADASEAVAYYRQSYGLRPDGESNRPLTAWTVEIAPGENA